MPVRERRPDPKGPGTALRSGATRHTVLLFSKLKKTTTVFGYFDPEDILTHYENK